MVVVKTPDEIEREQTRADLALVIEAAAEWAGEYGFADPARATEVLAAGERLERWMR